MAVESQDDQPSSVSNTQIHKEIRCVCVDPKLYVVNLNNMKLKCETGSKDFGGSRHAQRTVGSISSPDDFP